MPILFRCVECATETEVADDLAGKFIKCRECHTPGKVPMPEKVRGAEPATPPRLARPPVPYRCPFCGSEERWVWDWCWTPASTIALILLLPIFLAGAAFALGTLMATAAAAVTAAHVALVLGIGAVGLIGCVAAAVTVARPLLCEARQVCPDCRTRVG
jgi:hypothetical protein